MFPPLVPVLLCMVLFVMHLISKKIVTSRQIRSFSVIVLVMVVTSYVVRLVTGAAWH